MQWVLYVGQTVANGRYAFIKSQKVSDAWPTCFPGYAALKNYRNTLVVSSAPTQATRKQTSVTRRRYKTPSRGACWTFLREAYNDLYTQEEAFFVQRGEGQQVHLS